jgi:hypothetical protein
MRRPDLGSGRSVKQMAATVAGLVEEGSAAAGRPVTRVWLGG